MNHGCVADQQCEADEHHRTSKPCSVYLAPSSIPGAGMGMFTTDAVKANEVILPADGPSIPIIDPDYSEKSLQSWVDLFSSYWWERGSSDVALYEAQHSIEYQITMGALPNTHPFLNNFGAGFPSVVPYDDSMMDRSIDPGAGAFSYHMGRTTIALRDIEAGEEIFLEYPEGYTKSLNIPSRDNYLEAGRILSGLLKNKTKSQYSGLVWSSVPSHHVSNELTFSLFPKSEDDVDRILQSSNDSRDMVDLSFAIAKEMSINRRSVDWIKEHGMCLENILPGRSSIYQAGNGAISQRNIPKGNVVAPASTLQITDRNALRMPAFDPEGHMQLLLNYCFGHKESTLLLCPNTNAILINHCSKRRPDLHPCGPEFGEPNAEYRWAKWDSATEDWLEKSIPEMIDEKGRGLSLEIVATRDIKEGEEVFLDYGEEWEQAWDHHLEVWSRSQNLNKKETSESPSRISSRALNDELGPLPLSPNFSEEHLVDENGLLTACLYWEDETDEFVLDNDVYWEKLSVDEIINVYGLDYGVYFILDDKEAYSDGWFWPCIVTKKNEHPDKAFLNSTYTVRILQSHLHKETEWEERDVPRIITDYERNSIRHFPSPYESDVHLSNTFRHHIELRDEIFPTNWKNLKA